MYCIQLNRKVAELNHAFGREKTRTATNEPFRLKFSLWAKAVLDQQVFGAFLVGQGRAVT